MPAFDFPNSPTAGQQTTGSGGQVYTFDGAKWQASGGGLNQATADARYVNVSGDTMAGDLLLAADPTATMQAANKHYVDNAINLAGNYLGTWSVAANSPNISAGGSVANANYVATTVNPLVAETAPVGIPGIAGQSINNGDRIIWASGLSVWQILRGAGAVASFNTRVGAVTLSNADVTTVLPASSTTPAMDGAAAVGTGTTWARADHVHPVDTSRYAAANPSGYQTAAQVAAVVPGTSYADNGGFAVNQRGYVSGTALTAGVFGHDRWKAGAGGCTYTFTQSGSPATTVTITAGTLQQVVEGAAIVGGIYTLSWTGTAQGRVGAGSYAASPVTTGSLTAGANTTIEFNAGTLARVKFEAGSTATPWVAASPGDDLARCQRFYQVGLLQYNGYNSAGQTSIVANLLPVKMRASPVTTWADVGSANVGTLTTSSPGSGAVAGAVVNVFGPVTATGAFSIVGTFTASSDL